LLKLANFDVFDADYFKNPENLQADLTVFASQLGQGKTPLDLNTKNIAPLSITCRNGQPMRGENYLRTAAKALGFAKDKAAAGSKKAETLKHLLKLANFDVFDADYFKNPENLQADLTVFASQLGQGKTPLDLNTNNIGPLSITCQNGQSMRGRTYLKTAARAMSFAKDNKEAASKQAETLRRLKEIAGYLTKER
ncbi:MAG: hypothetical protein OEY44_04925, partial [Candidatus Peregrinibacteria bacterium]|nr:hypothetical protein [Candidatus Peregrinibacteria bacterium]